jgi:ABC-2 type transport system ATP-binding protein
MQSIEVMHLRKEFGTLVAVNDVSLSIESGQVVGLVGPNGAGKTTLLRMLATLLRPTDGQATLCGYNLHQDYLRIRRHIGFLPDFFNLYNDLTLRECLHFFAHAYGVPPDQSNARVEWTLDLVELSHKQDDFIRNLSRGMVQRLGLGTLLVRDPDIFLLDEPASGLDPKARIGLRNVLKQLSEQDKTIIISSHILTELSGFCTHVAFMDQGRLTLSGKISDIQKQMHQAHQVDIILLDDPDHASELMASFDAVQVKTIDGHTLTVVIDGPLDILAALNKHLVDHGVRVVGLIPKQHDLEEIFMSLTSRQFQGLTPIEGQDHVE